MRKKQADMMIVEVRKRLMEKRSPDCLLWRGKLSLSPISTSVAVFALFMADKDKYEPHIRRGCKWLIKTMTPDGSWGDSPESPSNMTATLLCYASLTAAGSLPSETKAYLTEKFGGLTDKHIIRGVTRYYGKDLTFSAPILVMCALAGVIGRWDEIPQLPFELSVLPQKLFRFLGLPVVSYAIPALIAVGILRYEKGKKNILSPLRHSFIRRSLGVLDKLQPRGGGFLEAAPLTGFVVMCMCGAGYATHNTVNCGIDFLLTNVCEEGAWPIDTDLACWVTALSIRALGDDLDNRQLLAERIQQNAFTHKHPFTGARAGGWGWTDLPGAVPDADDTAGALTALYTLRNGDCCREVEKGIEWLLALQNADGGMPTFCKGWGKLPFDRSSPDISAHAILALRLWMEALPPTLRGRCRKSMKRMVKWMGKVQADDGSWMPLWFGDQEAPDEGSPVYGTSMAVEYMADCPEPETQVMTRKGVNFILAAQNADGGWGGAAGVPSKVTLTARALSALASTELTEAEPLNRAFDFLHAKYEEGQLFNPEPIGLYFARLWYSEEMYNITFVLNALKKYRKQHYQHMMADNPNIISKN